jgi:hypothetical protein
MHFRDPADASPPKTAVSAADALRQKAEWEARGMTVVVTDTDGNTVTTQQLRDL